jgi:regulator of RNase E activity RraA
VWSTAVNFIPAKASPAGATAAHVPVFTAERRTLDGRIVRESVEAAKGDWLFVDDDGVLLVPASAVRVVLRGAQIVDRRECGLREAIRPDRPLAELIGLDSYVAGEAPLRSRA